MDKNKAFINKIKTLTFSTGGKKPDTDVEIKSVSVGVAKITCPDCGTTETAPCIGVEYRPKRRQGPDDHQSLSA